MTEYWWDLIGNAADPELAGFLLHEHGAAGLDWSNPEELHCYFFGTERALEKFVKTAKELGFIPVHIERLPLMDWTSSAEQDWQSVQVGEVTISPLVEPEGEMPLPPSAAFEIFIHPASGFGTGHHVTTRASLDLLLTLKGKSIGSVLDAGTGSGILAMVACRLFGATAKGIDQDETALSYARRNVFYNGFADGISLSTDPIERLAPSFDLILSNIYSEYHDRNESEYCRLLRPGGFLVLSGIARETRMELERKFSARWTLETSREDGRWISSLYVKN